MKLLWCLISFWALGLAHDIEQVFVELDVQSDRVEVSFQLDAELLLSKKFPNGKADLSRDWLHRLGEREYADLQKEGRLFIQNSFGLALAGESLEWQIRFPDFESKPYVFPANFNNSAVFEVEMFADFSEQAGELVIEWTPFEAKPDPTLLVEREGVQTATPISPGGSLVLANVIAASEELSEAVVEEEVSWLGSVARWIYVGYEHILPKGYDHILFIVGLVLLSTQWRSLLSQSALFTLAHSVTLFMATQGWVELPIKWVEVFIALSIVYVGVENLWLKEIKTQRYWLVFAFGLLHGLGFASVLGDILGNPEQGVLLPLLSFNVGVELGQVVVILLTLFALWVLGKVGQAERFKKYGSVTIAALALLWVVCRIFEFEVF